MIFIIYGLVIIILYLKRGRDVIMELPLLILFADITIPWLMFGKTGYYPQQIRMIYFIILFSLFIFIFHFNLGDKKIRSFFIVTIGFLIIALLNSTIYWEAFKKYIIISSSLLSFPVFYLYFLNKPNKINKFIRKIVLFNIIYILTIVLSTLLKLGTPWGYSTNEFICLVGLNIWGLYAIIYSVILSLFICESLKYKRYKNINIVLSIILAFILLLIFKRTLMLTLFIGIFIYLFTVTQKRKIINILYINSFVILLITMYWDIIKKSVFSRLRIYEFGRYIDEGRTREFIYFFQYWLIEGNWIDVLIGKDFFYSGRTHSFDMIYKEFGQSGRILHSDLANLLYTTGILGTVLFIIYLIKFFKRIQIFKKYSIFTKRMYLFILIAFILNLFSEGLDQTLNYFIPFAITGSLAGYLNSSTNTKKI